MSLQVHKEIVKVTHTSYDEQI